MTQQMLNDDTHNKLIELLISSKCLKFGEFKLKSGLTSEYYVDMRESPAHPELFQLINELLGDIVRTKIGDTDEKCLIGVPYGAHLMTGALAITCKMRTIPLKKEPKAYGTNELNCLTWDQFKYVIIEDVMSSGSSIRETIEKLDAQRVTDVIVVVNREQGGEELLKKEYPHVKLHCILKARDILATHRSR